MLIRFIDEGDGVLSIHILQSIKRKNVLAKLKVRRQLTDQLEKAWKKKIVSSIVAYQNGRDSIEPISRKEYEDLICQALNNEV